MHVEYWYRQFCDKYKDVLAKVFRHKWKTGQFWGTTCPCDACDDLSMYHDEVYWLERLKQGQTFAVIWDIVGHFNVFKDEKDVVWIPSWWDIQKAIYDYGFKLTREEHWAGTIYEALLVFLIKVSEVYKKHENTYKMLKEMIFELETKIKNQKNIEQKIK